MLNLLLSIARNEDYYRSHAVSVYMCGHVMKNIFSSMYFRISNEEKYIKLEKMGRTEIEIVSKIVIAKIEGFNTKFEKCETTSTRYVKNNISQVFLEKKYICDFFVERIAVKQSV